MLTVRRYEWIEMVLLHKSLFASKWMQALHLAFGEAFSADNSFALLYVMYNPVCRRDINSKNRLANKMLAEALLPVHAEYSGRAKRLGFYIKSAWVVLKFAFKNRALADCNPTLVLTASQQPHAALFKNVNRMLMLVNNHVGERDAKAEWKVATNQVLTKIKIVKMLGGLNGLQSTHASPNSGHNDTSSSSTSRSPKSPASWLQNIWNRSNRITPDSHHVQRYDDAPRLLVDAFALKREFVEGNIAEEARLSLLTLMIFPDAEDFGSSRECRRYKQEFDSNLAAFRIAFASLFRLSKDLEFADCSEKLARLTRTERFFQNLSDLIFPEEMKLLRNFHWLSDDEAAALFQRNNFPELEVDDLRAPTVNEVLKQLLAADEDKHDQSSESGSQAQVVGDDLCENRNTVLNIASSIDEPSQRQHNMPTHVAEVHPQTTAAVSEGFVRARPSMYASKQLLVTAGATTNQVASPQHVSVAVRSHTAPKVESKSTEEVSSAALVGAAAAECPLPALSDESTAALKRAVAAECAVKDLQAALQAASEGAGRSVEAGTSEADALSDALKSARAGTEAASQRADAAEAAAKRSAAEAKRSAADVASLTAQVTDLQAAALQAASQANKSPQPPSKKVGSTSAKVSSADAESAAALQRAAAAEAEVQLLSARLKDLHSRQIQRASESASLAAAAAVVRPKTNDLSIPSPDARSHVAVDGLLKVGGPSFSSGGVTTGDDFKKVTPLVTRFMHHVT